VFITIGIGNSWIKKPNYSAEKFFLNENEFYFVVLKQKIVVLKQ